MRVDHIAIAVNNVKEALKNYQNILNIEKIDIEEVPNEKVRVVMLKLEDSRIELMEPMTEDSPISKFLKDKGEGIWKSDYHVSLVPLVQFYYLLT